MQANHGHHNFRKNKKEIRSLRKKYKISNINKKNLEQRTPIKNIILNLFQHQKKFSVLFSSASKKKEQNGCYSIAQRPFLSMRRSGYELFLRGTIYAQKIKSPKQ